MATLVGAGIEVPCVDGTARRYRDLDCAASTPALVTVAEQVDAFIRDIVRPIRTKFAAELNRATDAVRV